MPIISATSADPLFPMDPHTGEKQPFHSSNGTFNHQYFNMKNSEKHIPPDLPNNVNIVEKVKTKRMRRKRNKWTLIVTFSSLVLIIIFITIAFLIAKVLLNAPLVTCNVNDSCNIQIVETIPSVLNYSKTAIRKDEISKHWKILITSASSEINILSSYWSLRATDTEGGPYPQAKVGEEIYNELVAAANRGVNIRIVQQMPSKSYPQLDTQELSKLENVQVRSLNMERLLHAGIIHTKSIIVDGLHLYVGSANFDWRSLAEVKELGTVIYNCSCTGYDIKTIFNINWDMAKDDSFIPNHWPEQYQTLYSKDHPLIIKPSNAKTYISTSPPEFCAKNRTSDIDAILDIILKAKRFINIAVMDYAPAIIYTRPKKYWNVIDDALRVAMYDRGIVIKLLISKWVHTSSEQLVFLKSLNEFGKMKNNGSIQVKWFTIPPSPIPFSRVNHNKYMVTENAAFISTSNWSGDYFISTGGISIVYNQTGQTNILTKDTYQSQMGEIFERDWNSKYAEPI